MKWFSGAVFAILLSASLFGQTSVPLPPSERPARGDVLTESVDDFTWGLILAITRRLAEGAALVARSRAWSPYRAYAVQHLWGTGDHAVNRLPEEDTA